MRHPRTCSREFLVQERRRRDALLKSGQHADALAIGQEVAEADPGRESYFKLGWLYCEVGRTRDALRVLRNALRFRSGPRYLIPAIHLHMAHAWFTLGKLERVARAIGRADRSQWKPRTAHNVHVSVGNYRFGRREYVEAAQQYESAAAVARDSLSRGRAIANIGLARLRMGDVGAAKRELDRAYRLQRSCGQWAELAKTCVMRAGVYQDLGQLPRALGMLTRAAEAFAHLGKPAEEANALANAGYLGSELGRWEFNRRVLDRAVAVAESVGATDVLLRARAYRAVALSHLESFGRAHEDLRGAEALSRKGRNPRGRMHLVSLQH